MCMCLFLPYLSMFMCGYFINSSIPLKFYLAAEGNDERIRVFRR